MHNASLLSMQLYELVDVNTICVTIPFPSYGAPGDTYITVAHNTALTSLCPFRFPLQLLFSSFHFLLLLCLPLHSSAFLSSLLYRLERYNSAFFKSTNHAKKTLHL